MGALSTSTNQWLEKHQSVGIALIDHLYNRLDGIYPGKWRAQFANQTAVDNWRAAWADSFADESLTPDDLRVGIAACRKLFDWPPSLPQFLKACRPPLDYERAFYEAVEQMRKRATSADTWSNPAIYWAAQTIGDDLQMTPYAAFSRRWAGALDGAIEKIKAGALPDSVPARLEALPAPGRQSVSDEQAAANLARLKAMLNTSKLVSEAA